MIDDLHGEITAINAIDGDATLKSLEEDGLYAVALPVLSVNLRLRFLPDYPSTPPFFDGVESTIGNVSIGYGNQILERVRNVLIGVWTPSNVCLFEMMQELETMSDQDGGEGQELCIVPQADRKVRDQSSENTILTEVPSIHSTPLEWIKTDSIIEKKSVFVAHACRITSRAAALAAIQSLINDDKHLLKATHNISAYRIRSSNSGASLASTDTSTHQLTYQDCDDNGETAAGKRILHLL